MSARRFWGGYLLGIVTVLALDQYDAIGCAWCRAAALVAATLAGLVMVVLDRRWRAGRGQVEGDQGNLNATESGPAASDRRVGAPANGGKHLDDSQDVARGGAETSDTTRAATEHSLESETPGASVQQAPTLSGAPSPAGPAIKTAEPKPDDLIRAWNQLLAHG